MTLDREQVGEQAAGQHDDQSCMGEMNAKFPPGPAKPFGMRRDQIHQQDRTNKMTARKDRYLPAVTIRWPPYEEALEVALLRFVDSEMNLRQCAGKNKHHGNGETRNRQLERRDEIEKSAQHLY